jgi:mannosyltransferase OCH1-like enzyme
LVRTVPEQTPLQVEQWWAHARSLHPDWDCVTLRDPLDPAEFPFTGDYWRHCHNGAQLAGLIRLETIYRHGGLYIDSDVELFRPLDPLRSLDCFAAWEDENVVPDAVFGATPQHPAILECLDLALCRLMSTVTDWRTGNGAWSTGPGVFTTVLPQADGVTLFGPEAFYVPHYTQKDRLGDPPHPDAYGRHHWHGSWLEA